VLGLALPAAAQTPATATSKLGWDQAAPTLATANGYQYALYVDAGARTVLTGTACTGTASPFVCTGALPPMTPATHTLELTTADIVSIPGTTIESVKSSPFAIRLVVAPAAGTGLRVVPGS
jgi:hypothetical protein